MNKRLCQITVGQYPMIWRIAIAPGRLVPCPLVDDDFGAIAATFIGWGIGPQEKGRS